MSLDHIDWEALLDLNDAGVLLKCQPRKIREFVAEGVLPCVRLPGSRALRFRRQSLNEVAKRYEMPATCAIEDEVGR